jgi:hypothetical protein
MTRKRQKRPSETITDEEVEKLIGEFFEHNYDLLREEGGHVLAEGTKRQALEQCLLYWRKLKAIATTVTETEVKLALPGQTTPKGRQFVVEGIVDIVREGDEVRMYDLKTHEQREVEAERDVYEDQLNVYAHIWKGIRGQRLDGTAIIATRLPKEVRDALRSNDPSAINAAIESWNPVIDLPFDEESVDRTIADFGRCVDAIEDGKFAPPSPKMLGKARGTRRRKDRGPASSVHGSREPTFAEIHCQNCDARFSCSSYHGYQAEAGRRKVSAIRDDDTALDDWIDENLPEA